VDVGAGPKLWLEPIWLVEDTGLVLELCMPATCVDMAKVPEDARLVPELDACAL
jgi:hypothetical protein